MVPDQYHNLESSCRMTVTSESNHFERMHSLAKRICSVGPSGVTSSRRSFFPSGVEVRHAVSAPSALLSRPIFFRLA